MHAETYICCEIIVASVRVQFPVTGLAYGQFRLVVRHSDT